MTGQIERSIITLLDIDWNSLQVQNLARSSIEYDEFVIDLQVIQRMSSYLHLEQMRVLDPRAAGTAVSEDSSDDSEEGLTSDSPVVPSISLNEANLHRLHSSTCWGRLPLLSFQQMVRHF